jgi:hypothetical protein
MERIIVEESKEAKYQKAYEELKQFCDYVIQNNIIKNYHFKGAPEFESHESTRKGKFAIEAENAMTKAEFYLNN